MSSSLALFRAAQRNDLAGVQRELERDADQEVWTALRVAVRNDCVDVALPLQCLFTFKFRIVSVAAESGSVQVMQNVFEMEPPFPLANVNQWLGRACIYGQKFAAQCLLTNKADVNPRSIYPTRRPPLRLAAYEGHAGVVMRLLQAKASSTSLNSPADIGGSSARHRYIVRLLLRALQVNGHVKSKDVEPKDV
jgi:hypothetical protein